ncbi:MAG: hypothetical protein DRI30_07375 [Chloroflexi bacterium]|nr:MAG: hypothetical protein DRI30_07375 [Chloroflexota bacterium]
MAVVVAAVALFLPAGSAGAQTIDDGLETAMHNPVTGKELSTAEDSPPENTYPVRGLIGDGVPDKIPYMFRVAYKSPVPGGPTAEEIGDDLLWGNLTIEIHVSLDPEGEDHSIEEELHPREGNLPNTYFSGLGEIDLPFDVIREMAFEMQAILFRAGIPIDTFTTEIRPGMPEMTIRSTMTIDGGDALNITSTVSGRTGLEFSSDYFTLSGRGSLDYEHFSVETSAPPQCQIATSTTPGYWRAIEVVLFDESHPLPVAAPENGHDLVPIDVVMAIDKGITESAVIQCGPIPFPLPTLLSFYAGFYSMHGGQTGNHPNEVDESRGGFVIEEWVAGEGNVIATRTYSREGPLDGDGVLREETFLELRWAE